MEINPISVIEAIRARPAMYVGELGQAGIHHLLYWVFDDILDNIRAGRGASIQVYLLQNGGCQILDDGPVFPEADTLPAAVRLESFTYEMPVGVPRGGAAPQQIRSYLPVLRALSSHLTVRARVGSVSIRGIDFERGIPVASWAQEGGMPEAMNFGVEFWPDPQIFTVTDFDLNKIRNRLQQMAATCSDLRADLNHGLLTEQIRMPEGMVDMLKIILKNPPFSLCPKEPFRLQKHQGEFAFDVAVQWVPEITTEIVSWVNSVSTVGGSHHLGVQDALQAAGLDSIGAVVALSVFVPQPRFSSPTKNHLHNDEIRRMLSEHLTIAFQQIADSRNLA